VNQHPTTWKADARDVEARVPCIGKVVLLNDFVAAGLGVLVLKPEDVVCLSSAAVVDRQPKVCVGAGTGLGEVRTALLSLREKTT
jgi:glucokinase